jgi:hypothetical protein
LLIDQDPTSAQVGEGEGEGELSEGEGDVGEGEGEGDPFIVDPPDVTPRWSRDDVGAQLQTTLGTLLQEDGRTSTRALVNMLHEAQAAGCTCITSSALPANPAFLTSEGETLTVFGPCSGGGFSIVGNATINDSTLRVYTLDIDGAQWPRATVEISANGLEIVSGTRSIRMSGYHSIETIRTDIFEFQNWYSNTVWLADVDTAGSDPWLRGRTAVEANLHHQRINGSVYVLIGGFIGSIGDNLGIESRTFIYNAGLCNIEATGDVSIIDPDGFWHDATFDAVDAATCDGCGMLRSGADSSAFCITDMSSLNTWELPR